MMQSTVLASMVASAGAAQWAVIMAGSKGYANYRHHADACHAYQIAKGHGIPESNIILLAYDDVAHNSRNPFPGKLFNKPTHWGVPGKDVYAGCKISYRGKDVTGENFLKVLSGDTSAPGPVLKSTAQDHVFVYYTDHGGPGILGVPTGSGYIHAGDLNHAIEKLQSKGGYKELLFYVDAGNSGSMFNNILKAPNAKAVTSSNPTESSLAMYCPLYGTMDADMVDGKHIGACLGDLFSVRWMEDSDACSSNPGCWTSETVGQQFSKVKAAVKPKCWKPSPHSSMECGGGSHVQEYGMHSFDEEPVGEFLGLKGELSAMAPVDSIEGNGVDSHQVEVHQAYAQVMRAETAQKRKEAEKELEAVLAQRHAADVKFSKIAASACEMANCVSEEVLEGEIKTWNMACHKASLETAVQHCGSFTDYSLRYSRLFANLCEIGMDQQTVQKAIEKGCGMVMVV